MLDSPNHRLLALIFCERIAVDEDSLSLMGVRDRLIRPILPDDVNGALYIQFTGVEGEYSCALDILGPNGTPVIARRGGNPATAQPGASIQWPVQDIAFTAREYGLYEFLVLVNNRHLASLHLEITQEP